MTTETSSPSLVAQADENRRTLRHPFLAWVEKIWLPVESAVNRLIGQKELNPLYHTGTISVYLLVLVIISGLYLTLFYRYGTTEAYESLTRIDGQLIGRIMRGIHRYASDAAVIFVVLHTLREFFKGHFPGSRWLAWVTGIILLGLLWATGTTGYWLVWDTRAQLINDGFTDILSAIPALGGPYALTFLTNERAQGLPLFFVILIFVHIFLPLIGGGFFWAHVIRLSRAKLLPPRFQMISMGIILAGISLALPATSTDAADLSQLPGWVGLDYYYLSYLPTTIRFAPLVFWGISLVAFAVLTALPWIFPVKRMAAAQVTLADCTGCTFCARDCPYTAIAMVPRSDDKSFKQEAVVNPDLCVSCGICSGACAWDAINLGNWHVDLIEAEITKTLTGAADLNHTLALVFTCQRHLNQGAQTLINKMNKERGARDDEVKLIALPCVDMVSPLYISRALDMGAREVVVAGCPPYDCDAREGNTWLNEKLARRHPPYLKKKEHAQRVRAVWLPPNEHSQLQAGISDRLHLPQLNWSHMTRAVILLIVVFFITVLAADIPFQPYSPNEALLQVGLRHSTQYVQEQVLSPDELANLPPHLQLEQIQGTGRFPLRLVITLDDKTLLDDTYNPIGVRNDGVTFVLEKLKIEPGAHNIRVQVDDGNEGELRTVIEESVQVESGQVIVVSSDPVDEFVLIKE